MEKIEVDFDVWKELTLRRSNEFETYNDVLRTLLGLGKKPELLENERMGIPLICDGVKFPHGTEFRKKYLGHIYTGKIENGYLVIGNQKFTNPSPAAMHITNNQVNGWIFWECKIPGKSDWIKINSLRNN